jgi:hypothetical protein
VNCTVHTMPQGSPEWHQVRSGRLTASRAAAMLATVKSGEAAARRDLRTRLALERITGRAQDDPYENADMRRGTELEPLALDAYAAREGVFVDRVGFLAHNELMAGGSPDAVIVGPGGGYDGLVECKAPRSATHLEYLRGGKAPAAYLPQLTTLLWLTGAPWVDFVSFDPLMPEKLRLFVVRLHAGDVDIAAFELVLRQFLREVEILQSEIEALAA